MHKTTNRKFSSYEQHERIKRNEKALSIIVFIIVSLILIGFYMATKTTFK